MYSFLTIGSKLHKLQAKNENVLDGSWIRRHFETSDKINFILKVFPKCI
jgi:hypothetical protein